MSSLGLNLGWINNNTIKLLCCDQQSLKNLRFFLLSHFMKCTLIFQYLDFLRYFLCAHTRLFKSTQLYIYWDVF